MFCMVRINKHLSIAFKDAHFLLLKQIENGLKIEEALTARLLILLAIVVKRLLTG